jgi:hypothetical protein
MMTSLAEWGREHGVYVNSKIDLFDEDPSSVDRGVVAREAIGALK